MRFSDQGVKTAGWVEAWIVDCLGHQVHHGYSKWAVIERSTNALLGYCGLELTPNLTERPEIALGYRLARVFWGQGYATEAATAVLEQARLLGLKRVVATVYPHNHNSLNVARKLGMHLEREVMLEGYTYPDHLYAIKL